jgi:hypothetical protein
LSSTERVCLILYESSLVMLINVNMERAKLGDFYDVVELKIKVKLIPKTIIKNTINYRIKSNSLFVFVNE